MNFNSSEQDKQSLGTTSSSNASTNAIIENLKKQIEARKKILTEAVASGKTLTLQDAQMKYLDQLSSRSKKTILLQQQIQNQLSERVKNALKNNDSIKLLNSGEGLKNEAVDNAGQSNSHNGLTSVESGRLTTKSVGKSQPKLLHFDSRVKTNTSMTRKPTHSFNFNTPGKFITMANNIRTKERLEKLQQQIQTTAKKTGIASAAKLAMVTMRHDAEPHNIPTMEWWDGAILPYQSYNAFMADAKQAGGDVKLLKNQLDSINKLIEHPIERLPADDSKDIHMPLFLTRREQKKIRTQRRRIKEIEKQERIRVGLEPPPPPKVKLSNLMRVLGSEAVQDPTKVEAHVREQIAARLKAHEGANAARKLTPEQKRIKQIKKLKEDTTLGVYIAVYRVWDLSNPSRKFKVDVNAQQLYLTGCILLIQDMNLVIVEGGPNSQKKFKRLMLNRIKWEEDVIGQCATHADRIKPKDENSVSNKCELVWEGVNRKKNFQDFKIKQVVTDFVAREFLKKHNCEHFWDLAYTLSLDNDIKQN